MNEAAPIPTGPSAKGRDAPGERNSLGAVLDQAFAPGRPTPADFAERVAKLAFELTGARSLTLLPEDVDAPTLATLGVAAQPDAEKDLARRALAEDRVAVRPPFALAVALPAPDGGRIALAVEMPPGNQVLASLAFERLELLRAICREKAATPSPISQAALEHAAAVAAGDWDRAQALVDALSAGAAGATCSLLAFEGAVVVSGQPNMAPRASLPSDLRARALAAVKQTEPADGLRLLGGSKPSHALILDGAEGYLDRIGAPLAAVFAGAAATPSWTRRHRKRLRAAAVAALLVVIGLVPIGDGVNLPATVSALEARIVTAPFDGRVAELPVRQGDSVKAGETLLLRMDPSELELALAEARAELAGAITRRDSLRGRANAADRRDADFTVRRETLRVKALTEKIALADVMAPIDGVVQGEDLSARRGAFIGLGGEIMRVIDPTGLRIEVAVSSRARARIAEGAAATFRADAAPNAPVETSVEAIAVSPLAEGPEPVYPALTAALAEADGLRPGMRGVARFEFDDAPLALILWRRLRDWALLTFWL